MANDDKPDDDGTGRPGGARLYLFWEKVDETIIYMPLVSLIMFGLALAENDVANYTLGAGFWATIYGLIVPFLIWRVGGRTRDRADPWRAAAILGIGALPMPAAMIPGTVLTTAPGVFATFPVVMVWSVTALLLAVRAKPRPRSPRFRALLLTAGALVWAAGALAPFAIPEGDELWFAQLVRLPVALLVFALVIKLLGEAAKSWRGGSWVVADARAADETSAT